MEKYVVVYMRADAGMELTALALLQWGKDQNVRSRYTIDVSGFRGWNFVFR